MAKFSHKLTDNEYAKQQVINVLTPIQGKGKIIESCGSINAYEESLKIAAKYCNKELGCSLKEMTKEQVVDYLTIRKDKVKQKTLNKDRLGLEKILQHVTGKLGKKEKITFVISSIESTQTSRIYTDKQIDLICERLSERNELAVRIIAESGLRVSETLEIEKRQNREPTKRPNKIQVEKFKGTHKENKVEYTIKGKGGLIRNFYVSKELSARMESKQLSEPKLYKSHGTNRFTNYDIGGGNALSKAFTTASQKALGWSRGIHGLRHSYVQNRIKDLVHHVPYHEAKAIVSQEVGHFRPDITDTYLR